MKKFLGGLEEEGLGILTEADVKETLKNKLNVDFKRYGILGDCNPPFAHKALLAEDKIGADKKLHQDFCPMYNNKKGTLWLTETKEIKDPYFGDKTKSKSTK